jgi:poly(3-hydroxybutyrate) depolymerase
VEGELDDISGSGQTEAAHKLCTNIIRHDSHHLEVKGAGHYGIFSGRRWREVVYPHVRDFILKHPDGAVPAKSSAKSKSRSTAAGAQAKATVKASAQTTSRRASAATRGATARKTTAAAKSRATARTRRA